MRSIPVTLGVEGVRGLARARLANLSHVCSNYRQSGPNRGREKAYYENARQAHYESTGPPTTLLLASKGQEQVAGFPHRYRRLGEVS